MAPAVYLSHPASLAYDTGEHPERAARIEAIERHLERTGWHGFERRLAPRVERDALELVHPADHVAALERFCADGGGSVDDDTFFGDGAWEAALRAAGGACELVDLLLAGDARTGFSACRPPGHHAEPRRPMGFCMFNNVAVAARRALTVHGLERVLILDWDVHHGNGTNDIFSESAQVLFVSIHQSPLYPGSGPASDRGAGAGAGFTLNLPVPPGSGDELFCGLVRDRVVPLAREYAPQLALISAGFDAHREDPLAECLLSEQGYARMTAMMRELAGELAIPLGVVLEGGYALDALARSVAATLAELAA